MRRQKWFHIHSMLGVLSGVLLFVICWSGTFAVVSAEIDWLLEPRLQITTTQTSPDWQKLADALASEFPENENYSLHAPAGLNQPAYAIVNLPQQNMRKVYLHPQSAEIVHESSYFDLKRFFRSLHMSFFDFGFGNMWGYYLVGILSIPMLISVLTPLIFYKRWWRGFYTLKVNKGLRVFLSDFHKFIGVWSLLFSLIIALTGVWYLAEFMGADFDYPAREPVTITDRAADNISVGEAVSIAKREWPALDIRSISPSEGSYWQDVIYIDGQTDTWFVRDRANFLMLRADNGDIVNQQDIAELGWPERWMDTVDPVHFGNFAGLTSKLIWFVFGLLLSIMILSGMYLHAKRLQSLSSSSKVDWRGKSSASYLIVAVLALSFYGGVKEFVSYGRTIGGVSFPPELSTNQSIFIAFWMVATLLLCLACIYGYTHGKQTASVKFSR